MHTRRARSSSTPASPRPGFIDSITATARLKGLMRTVVHAMTGISDDGSPSSSSSTVNRRRGSRVTHVDEDGFPHIGNSIRSSRNSDVNNNVPVRNRYSPLDTVKQTDEIGYETIMQTAPSSLEPIGKMIEACAAKVSRLQTHGGTTESRTTPIVEPTLAAVRPKETPPISVKSRAQSVIEEWRSKVSNVPIDTVRTTPVISSDSNRAQTMNGRSGQ
ncbi:hypothetical protein M422DRAFT_783865 [Sphaerobolus stellatus SS14]|uniref:Uncharacterized protein n=1 Tax=Sphaerobolus stellatus (strain SS14) TaxID=990650 RepID=A0A0C9U945_SPHS4|nr:hypothetical protein M422DRAFT_783865 [Sphaerobolus stellatus SS14]